MVRVRGRDVGRTYMRERFPDLAERLKTLVRRIMIETDPDEFDLKASEIWLTLEELERQRENKAA